MANFGPKIGTVPLKAGQLEGMKDTVAVCVEEGVDLWSGEAAKDESLSVEVGPPIQSPHSNTGEVSFMSIFGLEVKM